jgi:hypothetical protein
MSSTQTAAPAPTGGMQRIPFPTQSYQHAQSPPLATALLVNFFSEQEPADARTQAALMPTPGLDPQLVVGTGPIKAMNADFPSKIYVASGTRFYRLNFSASPDDPIVVDDLGEIGTPSVPGLEDYRQMVTIAAGVMGAVVCVPPNAFTCTHDGPLSQLGGTFPGNAGSVTYLNGYFVFNSVVTNQFFVCLLMDPTDFDALDFASPDAVPNTLDRVITQRGELWLMGVTGIEVWYDSGDQDFPFRRRAGSFIPFPASTPRSIALADSSVFWVSAQGSVMRSVGYTAKRVSTHAIEELIRQHSSTNILSAISYAQDGHIFYAINFVNRTLVYDVATDCWHNRSSSTDGSARWLPDAATPTFSSEPLLGDSQSGKLFLPVPSLATDDGVAVMRQATLPVLWANTRRAFCARVEIEMEVGGGFPAGDVMLEWSDDGGFSWTGGPRVMNAGTQYQTRKRVYTTRLGSFRQRVFRVTTHGTTTLYAVDADIVSGAS